MQNGCKPVAITPFTLHCSAAENEGHLAVNYISTAGSINNNKTTSDPSHQIAINSVIAFQKYGIPRDKQNISPLKGNYHRSFYKYRKLRSFMGNKDFMEGKVRLVSPIMHGILIYRGFFS